MRRPHRPVLGLAASLLLPAFPCADADPIPPVAEASNMQTDNVPSPRGRVRYQFGGRVRRSRPAEDLLVGIVWLAPHSGDALRQVLDHCGDALRPRDVDCVAASLFGDGGAGAPGHGSLRSRRNHPRCPCWIGAVSWNRDTLMFAVSSSRHGNSLLVLQAVQHGRRWARQEARS